MLGRLAHEQRRYARAVEHLERAYAAMPKFDEARRQYTESLAALGYDQLLRRDDGAAVEAWLRCVEVAPPGFGIDEIRNQLQLAWERLESRGVERLDQGERDGAIADFRLCLRIDPDQHWPAWLLATALHDDPDTDLAELERLCRLAVDWQVRHGLDRSKQIYLLAKTLVRRGDEDGARAMAAGYLADPAPDAQPQVLAALKRLAEE